MEGQPPHLPDLFMSCLQQRPVHLAWEAACSMKPGLICGLLEPSSLVLVPLTGSPTRQGSLSSPGLSLMQPAARTSVLTVTSTTGWTCDDAHTHRHTPSQPDLPRPEPAAATSRHSKPPTAPPSGRFSSCCTRPEPSTSPTSPKKARPCLSVAAWHCPSDTSTWGSSLPARASAEGCVWHSECQSEGRTM